MKKILFFAALMLLLTSCADSLSCEDSVRTQYPNATVSRVNKLTFVVVTDSCAVHIVRVDDAYTIPRIVTDYKL